MNVTISAEDIELSLRPSDSKVLFTPTSEDTTLFIDIEERQCPIIYSRKYDIKFFGLQKLHPFDVTKWGRIHQNLITGGIIKPGQTVEPKKAKESDLLRIHSKKYLESLTASQTVANIAEVCPLLLLPSIVLKNRLLSPLLYQTGGSILGVKLAIERGWAINLGGGFHHCCRKRGAGFCFYADISLCVKFLLDTQKIISRIMIVDLDAHQGNGHARDWGRDKRVFIFDAFNHAIYPNDTPAKAMIRCPILLDPFTEDDEYMELIERHLQVSFADFPPQFVIYNAGTDIMEGDPLGKLNITADGIIRRDALVFSLCKKQGIPILMLTSGGYQRKTAQVVADSISNLVTNSIITLQ